MPHIQFLTETPNIKIKGNVLDPNEIIYWGDKPMTVEQISNAVKQYHNIKVRSAEKTEKRRQRLKEAKTQEQKV